MREIQELGTLSETQAAGELYDLTLGVDRVSLADVLRNSKYRAIDCWRPTTDHRWSRDFQPRERLQAEIDDLGQSTARYLALSFERQKLETEIGRLEAENSRCEQQARELAMAQAVGAMETTNVDRSPDGHANRLRSVCPNRLWPGSTGSNLAWLRGVDGIDKSISSDARWPLRSSN